MRRIICYALMLAAYAFSIPRGHGQILDIRIFSGQSVGKLEVKVMHGHYRVVDRDRSLRSLHAGDKLSISPDPAGIQIISGESNYMVKGTVGLLSRQGGILRITTPKGGAREYAGDFRIAGKDGSLLIINQAELEEYVAGVVQSEAGITGNTEMYKAQAVICRTYALNDHRKHLVEGYNLCDSEHCQVYKYRCTKPDIQAAVKETRHLVMTTWAGDLITAAFHTNSGGQTVNSEDVWTHTLPYLRSVADTFSLGWPKSAWEFRTGRAEWLSYLKDTFRLNVGNKDSVAAWTSFRQDNRSVWFSDSIPLKKIRRDLSLPSTFFSIRDEGDTLVFTGRGYGHGAGLSQEGALRMAMLGYTFKEILNFYYTGIGIVELDKLALPPGLRR